MRDDARVSPRHVSGWYCNAKPALRARFNGQPEFVENFFEFVAQEVREYLALLGARTLDEVIGDVTKLSVKVLDDPPTISTSAHFSSWSNRTSDDRAPSRIMDLMGRWIGNSSPGPWMPP